MLETILGLVVGVVLGSVVLHGTHELTKRGSDWYPASVSQIRNKLRLEGKLDDFLAGRYLCPVCNTPVTFETLWSIVEDGGSEDFICRNPDCYRRYILQLHDSMIDAT